MGIKDAIAASGPGARTGKLTEVGDILRGTVISADLRQARDDNNKPDFWDDDNPKQQVVILLQTDLDEGPNDDGEEDDGKRTFYVKWWSHQKKAFLDAIRAVEADDLYPGDLFAVKYIGDGEKDPKKKMWSAPKLLKFKITPKPKGAGAADEFDGDDEVEQVAEPVRKPVPRPVARKATAQRPSAAEANAKKLKEAGLDADDL